VGCLLVVVQLQKHPTTDPPATSDLHGHSRRT
jgi:hypothetical protein